VASFDLGTFSINTVSIPARLSPLPKSTLTKRERTNDERDIVSKREVTLHLHNVTLLRDVCIAASLERISNQINYEDRQSEHATLSLSEKLGKGNRALLAARRADFTPEKFDRAFPHRRRSNFLARRPPCTNNVNLLFWSSMQYTKSENVYSAQPENL